jgi:hypothetical protein
MERREIEADESLNIVCSFVLAGVRDEPLELRLMLR